MWCTTGATSSGVDRVNFAENGDWPAAVVPSARHAASPLAGRAANEGHSLGNTESVWSIRIFLRGGQRLTGEQSAAA